MHALNSVRAIVGLSTPSNSTRWRWGCSLEHSLGRARLLLAYKSSDHHSCKSSPSVNFCCSSHYYWFGAVCLQCSIIHLDVMHHFMFAWIWRDVVEFGGHWYRCLGIGCWNCRRNIEEEATRGKSRLLLTAPSTSRNYHHSGSHFWEDDSKHWMPHGLWHVSPSPQHVCHMQPPILSYY